MRTLAELAAGLPQWYHNALQMGVSALLQSTLLLFLGLLLGRGLIRRGPAVQAFIYRATLTATLLGVCFGILFAGRFQPLWKLALPSAQGAYAPGNAPGESRDRASELPRAWTFGTDGIARAGRPLPSQESRRAALTAQIGDSGNGGVEFSTEVGKSRHADAPAVYATRFGWLTVAIGVIGSGGALLGLLWLGLCHLSVLRLRRRCVPITEGSAVAVLRALCAEKRLRAPRLLCGTRVQSPFLTGLWHPAILLPATYATDFDGPAMRAILAHELAHLARGDCAWNLLARTACVLGWMQPLVWKLRRELEQACEEACDQAVLAAGCAPESYARCLLTLAERRTGLRKRYAAGVGVIAFRSSLGRRIQRILDSGSHPALFLSPRQRLAVLTGILLMASLCPALVSATAVPAPPAPRSAPLSPPVALTAPLSSPLAPSVPVISDSRPPIRIAAASLALAPRLQKPKKTTQRSAARQKQEDRQLAALHRMLAQLTRLCTICSDVSIQRKAMTAQVSSSLAQIAELNTKYTPDDPRVKGEEQRLEALQSALTTMQMQENEVRREFQNQRQQLVAKLKYYNTNSQQAHQNEREVYRRIVELENVAEQVTALESSMKQMEVPVKSSPSPTPTINLRELKVQFGLHSHNAEYDSVTCGYVASGRPEQHMKVTINVVITYYNAGGKLLTTMTDPQGSVTRSAATDATDEHFGCMGVPGLPYIRAKAPKDAVKVRYHYEARGEIYDGATVYASDRKVSETRELNLK